MPDSTESPPTNSSDEQHDTELGLVTLDLSAPFAGLDQVDATVRARLRDALRDVTSAENDRRIMDTIREVLADEAPGQTAVGVVFETAEHDNGYFVKTYGQVLFDDGTVTEIDFNELDSAFSDEWGARGRDFTVAVDLRPGALCAIDGDDDGSQEDIFERFGVPMPKDPYGRFDFDGLVFDTSSSRDTYARLLSLPEDKILYLARSAGTRLQARSDALYRQVAHPDCNPDWVTGMAAAIALAREWIGQDEHDRLNHIGEPPTP